MIWLEFSHGLFALLHVETGMKPVLTLMQDGLIYARSSIAETIKIIIITK